MKRFIFSFIFLLVFTTIHAGTLGGAFLQGKEAYAQPEFVQLSQVLGGLKPSELSQCISFVKGTDMDSKQIADFVYQWKPEEHKRTLAAIFKGKITRLTERLKMVDYEQLIVDVDLIKNSHLTTAQISKMLKGLKKT